MLMCGAQNNVTSFKQARSKRDHLSAFNSVQFTMYYTFFFNVDAVVCQNNGQFQVWELNISQFIVIVEIKYFLNLNEYYLPIFILSIHFRQISFVKITEDIQSNNNNNIVLSMLYAEICLKFRRHNALPFGLCIMPSNLGTYFGIFGSCIMPSNLGTYFGI